MRGSSFVQNNKVVETTFAVASGLYWIAIPPLFVSIFALSYKDSIIPIWHGRLDHPYVVGYNLQLVDINSRVLCQACM